MPFPRRRGLITLLAAPLVVAGAVAAPASATAATASPNLIRNAGAESTGTAPTSVGAKVAVKDWSVSKSSNFTAVRYGAPEFISKTSPGPKSRGKNFFAGGPTGEVNAATQRDQLKAYASWVRTGRTKFTLSGWLGGYSSQNDHAVVSVTWTNAKGAALSSATLASVSATQRKDVTGLLHRTLTGTVPKTAASVLVRITMHRTDGNYDDGYADDLNLHLSRG